MVRDRRSRINMNASELWQEYQQKGHMDLSHERYDAWQFGAAPDKLLALVLEGTKCATASLYEGYEFEDEPVPNNMTYSVILDSQNNAQCIIKNSQVIIQPFKEFDEKFAYIEGEGDRSLEYWRRVHIEFFKEEASRYGTEFTEDSLVVGEIFEVVYRIS